MTRFTATMTPTAFKEARRKLGFTQSALAPLIGCGSQGEVSRYENGTYPVPRDKVLLIDALLSGWRPSPPA